MGCETGGHTCTEVLARLVFFIDQELEDADCAQIQQHLDECEPCMKDYHVERAVKALVARSCCELAPPDLRERVRISIREVHIQITEG